jgi:hypothetical protein
MESKWNQSVGKLLYLGGPAISIFLIDSAVTDPVNAPKLFLLGVVACGLAGAMALAPSKLYDSRLRWPIVLTVVFILVSLFAELNSKGPFIQGLYGVYGRNNGLLTYLFLSILFVGALVVCNQKMYSKLYFGFLVAGLVNIAYCTWVALFGDFLSWNNPYKSVLGTFGNPNFIGAFLGMFTTGWIALAISPNSKKSIRISSLVVLPLAVYSILQSNAIQGRVLFLGGIGIVLFYWIKLQVKKKTYLYLYSFITVVMGVLSVAGALQKGPFTELIYKTSVSLRGQYWLSGWNTGLSSPGTGVGFDGLGDWYRRMRDAQALILPGPNTVVNTAHNVPLDLLAFGGFPLFVSYLAIILFTMIAIIRYSLKLDKYDPIFVGLVAMWICYQVQSLISINQIGLAIWGWIFGGALIGYTKLNQANEIAPTGRSSSKRKEKASQGELLGTNIFIGVGALVGALIAIPPVSADMKWMSAQRSGNAAQLEESLSPSYMNPQNSFKYLSSVIAFEQSNLNELSHKYALEAIAFNPDNFDIWRALYTLKASTPQEREMALKKMKELDPLNPDVTG